MLLKTYLPVGLHGNNASLKIAVYAMDEESTSFMGGVSNCISKLIMKKDSGEINMEPATLCLALAVYFEARNQDIYGQYLVVDSVINRVRDGSSEFGDGSVCGTVDKGYASGRWDMIEPKPKTKADKFAWEMAKAVAWAKQDGFSPNPTPDILWYHTINTYPYWAEADYIEFTGRIGDHYWYTRK